MEKVETFDFGQALSFARAGRKIARTGWNNPNIYVAVQVPDEHSANTEPYLYMVKLPTEEGAKAKRFPLDLSAESIFAEDWFLVPEAAEASTETAA